MTTRHLKKLILVEAGQRSKEIQALLKLEEVGAIRGLLKTASNKLSRTHGHGQDAVGDAEDALRRHLGNEGLEWGDVLAAVNSRRRQLGLSDYLKETDFTTALDAGVSEGPRKEAFSRDSALRDLAALESACAGPTDVEPQEIAGLIDDLVSLEGDPALLSAILGRSFIECGLELVDGTSCPLCDKEWDVEGLKDHLRAKLAKAERAEAIQERVLRAGSGLASHAKHLIRLVGAVEALAIADKPAGLSEHLGEWSRNLEEFSAKLSDVAAIATLRGCLLESC